MKYLLTVLITLFAVWLGFMLWFHFPKEGAFGLLLVVPIVILSIFAW